LSVNVFGDTSTIVPTTIRSDIPASTKKGGGKYSAEALALAANSKRRPRSEALIACTLSDSRGRSILD
jgi:hypothetical protein